MITPLLALALLAAARPSEGDEEFRTLRVGVVVYEGVELLDMAGPAEVFSAAGSQLSVDEKPLFEVVTVAPRKGPLLAHGGMTIEPCFSVAERPRLDLIVIPGGETGSIEDDPAAMAWLRGAAPQARIVMSVCNGAFVLAQLGLLDGGEATTFHSFLGFLRESAPKARVLTGRRVVDNGHVLTTGGVSCGIDGALHVVARLGGRRLADAVAAYLEFRWTPEPALEGTYSEWASGFGDRVMLLQRMRSHRGKREWKELEEVARELTDLAPEDGAAWYELGTALLAQGRFDDAIEASEEAAKSPARRTRALYNVCCSQSRKGEVERALDALARAVDAGWDDVAWTQHDEDLVPLRELPRFAELLARMKAANGASNRWAPRLIEDARTSLEAGRIDRAMHLASAAIDGGPDPANLRVVLQPLLADRALERSALSARARRWLAAHPWTSRLPLAPPNEPGTPIVVTGVVRDDAGASLAGARLHLAQPAPTVRGVETTDTTEESPARLEGWLECGSDGAFELASVRPPDDSDATAGAPPLRIRGVVAAAGCETRRVELVFADDPRLTPKWRQWATERGWPIVELRKDDAGLLRGRCEIRLARLP